MAKNRSFANRAILIVLAVVLLVTRTAVFVSAKRAVGTENGGECVDSDPINCPYWADIGECKANPGYMHVHCKKSCNRCQQVKDRDEINKIIAQRIKENQERQSEARKSEETGSIVDPNEKVGNNDIGKRSSTATASISSTGEVETTVDSATTTKNGNQGSVTSTSTTRAESSTTKPNKKNTKIDVNTGFECVDLDENCPFWAATVRSLYWANFVRFLYMLCGLLIFLSVLS